MIQRIQSIYLLLGGLCLLAVVFFPVLQFEHLSDQYELSMCSFSNGEEQAAIPGLYWAWLVVAWIAGLIMIANIFGYKNRKGQMAKGRILYVLILIVLALAGWMSVSASDALPQAEWVTVYHIAFYLPAAALAFNWLANRSIRNDEDLVKSLDRLR
ncbi:MAG: DUF4293 domain-containing protein [Flavobacteriales bacterium]|nr:DUF4293 domain-containing protein [Flavobacteriales bacterium]